MLDHDDDLDGYDDEIVGACGECGADIWASEDTGADVCEDCRWSAAAQAFGDAEDATVDGGG